MHTGEKALYAIDAIFFSPHKFVGGVGTPGVLVVKKQLLQNAVPSKPGGGTVFYVTEDDHRYLQNFEEREEGGTPDIIGSIRCGLAMQLKESVGVEAIHSREQVLIERALEAWSHIPGLHILGGETKNENRLAIFSFLIEPSSNGQQSEKPLFLHYNFVSALLNDLFGIQSRGGCACAGPYSQKLMGISPSNSKRIEGVLLQKNEVTRPGFTRLNLHFSLSDEEAQYIIDAVSFVARNGWRLLPEYSYYEDTGEWRHRSRLTKTLPNRRWLGRISYKGGKMSFKSQRTVSSSDDKNSTSAPSFASCLKAAHKAVEATVNKIKSGKMGVDQQQFVSGEAEATRWYLLPSEVSKSIASLPSSSSSSSSLSTTSPPSFSSQGRVTSSEAGIIDPLRYSRGGFGSSSSSSHDISPTAASSPSFHAANASDNTAVASNGGAAGTKAEAPPAYKLDSIPHSSSSSAPLKGQSNGDASTVSSSTSLSTSEPLIQVPAPTTSSTSDQSEAPVCMIRKRKENGVTIGLTCKNCFHDHTGGVRTNSVAECVSCPCVDFVVSKPK